MSNPINLKEFQNVLIVHHNDLDGIAAAAVVTNAVHESISDPTHHNITYLKYCYEDTSEQWDVIDSAVSADDLIIIVDVSMDEKSSNTTFHSIISNDADVIWIDHHQTSLDFLNSDNGRQFKFKGIVNTSRCGAYLAYQYLCDSEDVPLVLKMVDDHDRWIHSFDPGYLNAAFDAADPNDEGLKKPDSKTWKYLLSDDQSLFGEELLTEILKTGQVNYDLRARINVDYQKRTGKIIRFTFISDSEERHSIKVNTINAVGNSDTFGSSIYEEADIAMRYNVTWVNNMPMISCTFYSPNTSNIKCNAIANLYGGGGHPHSAGCRMSFKNFVLSHAITSQMGDMPTVDIHVRQEDMRRIFD